MKGIYLTGIIILSVIRIVVFFQNLGNNATIAFLGTNKSFITLYPILLIGMGGLGVLITLFVQICLKEKELSETNTFDL